MTTDTNALLIILSVGIAIAIALGLHTEWRLNRVLRGKSGRDLEETIIRTIGDIERFKQFRKEIEAYLLKVESRLAKGARGIETVRFNPFKGTGDGGNQSFATAIINEEGDGVAFSSIYSRERVSMFAKPLKNGQSEYELTAEEKMAIRKAEQSLLGK